MIIIIEDIIHIQMIKIEKEIKIEVEKEVENIGKNYIEIMIKIKKEGINIKVIYLSIAFLEKVFAMQEMIYY